MSKHSKHSKGDGAPRRHAKLPVWVMIVGGGLLAASFASGIVVWNGLVSMDDSDGISGVSPNWRRLHIALSPFVWGLMGFLTHQHIRTGWRDRACLVSGSIVAVTIGGLALSGLYLSAGLNLIDRSTVTWAHRGLGAGLPLVLLIHWLESVFWVRKLLLAAPKNGGA